MTILRKISLLVLIPAMLSTRAYAAAVEDARGYHDRAKAEFALQKYPQAADDFERAFELKGDPAILYNAALSHRLAGNKERALALYQSYLRVFGRVGKWREVEARIEELKAAIAQERTAPTTVSAVTEPKPETQTAKPVEPPPVEAPPVVPPVSPPAAKPAAATPSSLILVGSPDASAAERQPATHGPLFWVGVAGALVLIAGGAALAVALSRSPHDPTPSLGGFTAGP